LKPLKEVTLREKIKVTIEYYQKIIDKLANILILTSGGTASLLLSHYSQPNTAKLFLIVIGGIIVTFSAISIAKFHSSIKKLIEKL
jgi:predicted DNA-binding antitoxin AbrB/MazE fold protein